MNAFPGSNSQYIYRVAYTSRSKVAKVGPRVCDMENPRGFSGRFLCMRGNPDRESSAREPTLVPKNLTGYNEKNKNI